MKNIIRISAAFFIFFTVVSCASTHPPSRFLEHPAQALEGPFFKQEYVKPHADFTRYHKIKISAVHLEYLDSDAREKFKPDEIRSLAEEFRETVESQIQDRSGFFVLGVNQEPDHETLVVELALVGVDRPWILFNIATTILLGPAISSGNAVFEAKIVDGQTGDLLAEISEKRRGGALKWDGSILLRTMITGPYTQFDHARAAFEFWGKRLTDFLAEQKLRKDS